MSISPEDFQKLLKKYSPDDQIEILNQVYEKVDTLKKQKKNKNGKKPLADFKTFIMTYFSHYIDAPFGVCQNQLIKDIEDFKGRKNRKPLRKTRAMPRGFGKSSIVTLFGVLWHVLNSEHKFVIILSSTKNTATQFLQAIIDEVEQNDKLIDDHPGLEPAKDFKNQTVAWRDSEIVFANGVRIMALGWLNSVRGLRKKNHRPDFIICDDPDEEKDVNSETRMERKYRWFDRAVLHLGGILGVDVFVNYTTIAENCVGEYIYKNNVKYSDWDKKKYKAIEKDSNGKEYSTWEEGRPLEFLLKKREEDPIGFATEMQNEPLPEANQRFKGLIKTYNYPPTENYNGWKLALAVDLSQGKNEESDYSAIIGVGMSPSGHFYQIYEDIKRRTPEAIHRDIIAALICGIPWSILGIETSGNQEYFIGESEKSGFRRTLSDYNKTQGNRKILIPIIGINSKGDKIERINNRLQKPIASGLLKLMDTSILLYKQLDNFPYDFKDGPDALDMAYQLLVDVNEVVTSKSVKTSTSKINSAEDIQRQRAKKMGVDFDLLKKSIR